MTEAGIALGCNLVAVGAISIALSLPLLRGKIKPNKWYGFRIPKAFESEENWFKINRYGAQQMIKWSLVLVATGLVALLLPLQNQSPLLIVFCFPLLLCAFVPIIQVFRFVRKL